MESLFLIKYGEISLKGKNRPQFEAKLIANIKKQFPTTPLTIIHRTGRVYLSCQTGDEAEIREGLLRTFGIVSFANTVRCEKNIDEICASALRLAKEAIAQKGPISFKVESRRTDKSFPLSSYQIACTVGDYLKNNCPGLSVDVRRPDWLLSIEIREKAFLYGPLSDGLHGLPVGCNGKGLLLLSGGIDSPVAGFLMAKRGMDVEAVYFHTPPFTSEKAKEKVLALCAVLKRFIPGFKLFVVQFTDVQVAIKEKAFYKAVTLMSRASMMRIAEIVAGRERASVLITGECLGQVASQTPESLNFTEHFISLPVLRPLISMDKTEIIAQARVIGTYEISTRPYADCCTLFAPEHPIIKPDTEALSDEYRALELDSLIDKAADSFERIEID